MERQHTPDPGGVATSFFGFVVEHPRLVLAVGVLLVLTAASALPRMQRDTSTDAFVEADNPALITRDEIRERFGLHDATVLVVTDDDEHGVFDPEGLALIDWLTHEARALPAVRADRVTSLSTELHVSGDGEALFVEPIMDRVPADLSEARRVLERALELPQARGLLAAEDGTGSLVLVEARSPDRKEEVFLALRELAERAPPGGSVLIAGEGAASGYLGHYIDEDARLMQPLSLLAMLIVLAATFRTARSLGVGLVVITATNVGAMGLMAWLGMPYYLITGALPAILTGISVADSVHILGVYYRRVAEEPDASSRTLVLRTMTGIWRPIVLTSITTLMGFLGIAVTSTMPPMQSFAVVAMIGVTIALLYSCTVVPALLVLLPPRSSPAFRRDGAATNDVLARLMERIGGFASGKPSSMLLLLVLLLVGAGYGALQLRVDSDVMRNFERGEPIVAADRELNGRFLGGNFLDVMVRVDETEGLYDPARLAALAGFEEAVLSLPHVRGAQSVLDELRLMDAAFQGRSEGELPATAAAAAQYVLLYTAQSAPDALERRIDYAGRTALLRFVLDSSTYSETGPVVAEVERLASSLLVPVGLRPEVSGRVALDYHWMKPLAESHFGSGVVALVLVVATSALLFRSLAAGIVTVVPVCAAVVIVYGFMGIFGIWLEPATSMFTAIAIGLGIDFAIHLLDRLRAETLGSSRSWEQIVAQVYRTTGRALLVNFLCIFLGFAVLFVSVLPVHDRFGGLTSAAIAGAFLFAVVGLPALCSLSGLVARWRGAGHEARRRGDRAVVGAPEPL